MPKLESPRATLTVRTPPELHSRLADAAAWRGLSLNSFILQAAAREADAILQQERVLRLSGADAKLLLDLLDQPPKPNAALKRAFARRKDILGASR